jgi:hypothetical protein
MCEKFGSPGDEHARKLRKVQRRIAMEDDGMLHVAALLAFVALRHTEHVAEDERLLE